MERSLIFLDEVQYPINLGVVVDPTEFKPRIHKVQWQDRWANSCLEKIPGFQVVRGNYYCIHE